MQDFPLYTYRLSFSARKIGAIGVVCEYTATRRATTPQAAKLALYDEYEHIIVYSCTEVR